MSPRAKPASTTLDLRTRHSTSRSLLWLSGGLMLIMACVGVAHSQDTQPTPSTIATQPATGIATTQVATPTPPDERYGAWVLIPPLVTIILAIAFRQVIPALLIGVLVAAYMIVPCRPAPPGMMGGDVIWGLRLAVEKYFLGALASLDHGNVNYGHIKIVVFTFLIGGMVGVVAANGGTRAVVQRMARWASTRERGQLAAWFAGLVVFFDDYANAMIVGPAMRPMADRLRISRAKLAYIVDSTAAPVSSIALIGTWVGAEIGYIQSGLSQLTHSQPEFLHGVTAYGAFLASIPYRFYAILALVMVFVVGWLGRDFGPMRQAECKTAPADANSESDAFGVSENVAGKAWFAAVPVLILVFLTMGLLVATGWPADGLASVKTTTDMPRWLGLAVAVLQHADANNSILYGALGALMTAVAISLVTGTLGIGQCVDAATRVMSRMMVTVIVLVLAWTLSNAMEDLMLGTVAVELLKSWDFDARWLPLLIFSSSCIVSFATGTSWGTMGILCPATVTIAAHLLANQPADTALPIFYASVGAVLSGSVFGDHCSPISDTTVLSALASECSLEKHVWTQMPYALTVAGVSIVCGDVLCRYYNQHWAVGLALGAAALLLIVLAVGRKPTPTPA